MKKYFLLLFIVLPSLAYADCLQGRNGQVYCGTGECKLDNAGQVHCSSYKDGGAAINSLGRVVCGAGQCLQGSTGQVLCSSVENGGAALNSAGNVKCFGACEPGSESMCESTEGL